VGVITLIVGYGLDSTALIVIGVVVGVLGIILTLLGMVSSGPSDVDSLAGVTGELQADDLDVFDLQGTMSVDLDTDEVLATGRRADALLVHIMMTNHTAGQVDPLTVDTYRSGHRVAFLTVEVQPVGDTYFRATRAIAVPPDKLHSLDVGCRLPVAFDDTQPEPIIAIDWTQVPG
jgi:hypothetical protein